MNNDFKLVAALQYIQNAIDNIELSDTTINKVNVVALLAGAKNELIKEISNE